MGHRMDSRGITPSSGGGVVPPGRYLLEIQSGYEERQSNNGDYQVVFDCKVIEPKVVDETPVYGSNVRFHRVTFLPRGAKGAGIWMHFLKQIGEPWGEMEQLDIEPARWVGKKFWAKVIQETYERKDGSAGLKNSIKEIEGGVEPIWKPGDAIPGPKLAMAPDHQAAMSAQTPSSRVIGGADDDIPF